MASAGPLPTKTAASQPSGAAATSNVLAVPGQRPSGHAAVGPAASGRKALIGAAATTEHGHRVIVVATPFRVPTPLATPSIVNCDAVPRKVLVHRGLGGVLPPTRVVVRRGVDPALPVKGEGIPTLCDAAGADVLKLGSGPGSRGVTAGEGTVRSMGHTKSTGETSAGASVPGMPASPILPRSLPANQTPTKPMGMPTAPPRPSSLAGPHACPSRSAATGADISGMPTSPLAQPTEQCFGISQTKPNLFLGQCGEGFNSAVKPGESEGSQCGETQSVPESMASTAGPSQGGPGHAEAEGSIASPSRGSTSGWSDEDDIGGGMGCGEAGSIPTLEGPAGDPHSGHADADAYKIAEMMGLLEPGQPLGHLSPFAKAYGEAPFCRRLLETYDGDVRKSSERFQQALKWREQNEALITLRKFQQGGDYRVLGKDTAERPVLYMCMKNQMLSLGQCLDQQNVCMLQAVDNMPPGVETATHIWDLHGMSFWMNMNPAPLFTLLQMLEGYFAGRLHRLIIVDMPGMANFLKDAIWPLVPAKSHEMIKFMTAEQATTYVADALEAASAARVQAAMSDNRDKRLSLDERKRTWMRMDERGNLVPAFD